MNITQDIISDLQTQILGWTWELHTTTDTNDRMQIQQRLWELELQLENCSESI